MLAVVPPIGEWYIYNGKKQTLHKKAPVKFLYAVVKKIPQVQAYRKD